jgi:Zn-dependent metalloprotease
MTLSSCANASSVHRDVEITPAHRAVLEYLSRDKTLIALSDPSVELRKIGERGASGASGAIVRFEQLHHGIPIVGALLVCEVRNDGVVRIRANDLRPVVDVSVIHKIEARAAVRAAAASLHVQGRLHERQSSAELVVVPAGALAVRTDTLGWSVTLEGVSVANRARGTWRVVVDAMTGAVLHSDRLLPRD